MLNSGSASTLVRTTKTTRLRLGRHFRLVLAEGSFNARLAASQLEADAVDGLDRGLAAGAGKLGADVPDMAVDGAVGDVDVAGIGGVEDQLAREDKTRPRQQRAQDGEFQRRQRNRRIPEARGARVRIEREPAMVHGLAFRRRRGIRARRRIALTRATSSRGLNGFVT